MPLVLPLMDGHARLPLAGTGRQGRADIQGELLVLPGAGQFLQALGDERGGLGGVTPALRDPRTQEGELCSSERRARVAGLPGAEVTAALPLK